MKTQSIINTTTALALSVASFMSAAETFSVKDNLFASIHMGSTEYDTGGDGTTGFRARMGLDLSTLAAMPEKVSVAAEVHYTLYGQESDEYETFFGTIEEKVTFSGMGIGGRAGYDVNDAVRVYGFSGFERLSVDYEVSFEGESFGDEELDSSTELYYGFGARYAFDKKFGVQAEYKTIDEVNFTSIGLSFDY